jgi:hypothetical protein
VPNSQHGSHVLVGQLELVRVLRILAPCCYHLAMSWKSSLQRSACGLEHSFGNVMVSNILSDHLHLAPASLGDKIISDDASFTDVPVDWMFATGSFGR